jgi:hypothetical protein
MYKEKRTMCKLVQALVTILIILLSLGTITACKQQYPEEKMTTDEVINIVLVYGVPEFPISGAYQVGQWAAVYEGEGKWRIQGTLAVQKIIGSTFILNGTEGPQYESVYYQTTWSYSNNEVKLVEYKR